MNRTRSVGVFMASLLAATLAGIVGREAVKAMFTPNETRPGSNVTSLAATSRIASEVNKTMPIMVDQHTELMNVTPLPATVVYNYRLVSVEAGEFTIDDIASAIRPGAQESACSSPLTRDGLLKRGITMRFSYNDRNRKHIGAFDVRPADCGF